MLFFIKDKYKLVLELMSLTSSRFIPNSEAINLLFKDKGEKGIVFQSFQFDKVYKMDCIYNSDLIAELFMNSAPKNLGLKPFHNYRWISSEISVEEMLKQPIAEIKDNILYIGGEGYGVRNKLYNHCKPYELDLKKHEISDVDVVSITKDYFCPFRQRVVLHKGCCYSAPIFIRSVEYLKSDGKEFSFFEKLVEDNDEHSTLYEVLQNKHHELLAKLKPYIEIIYYEDSEKIYLNNKYLTKYMPAKILYKILDLHQSNGRTVFSNKEFRDDSFIVSTIGTPQFEVRFSRLVGLLNEYEAFFQIKKVKKGEFAFIPKAKINLRVVAKQSDSILEKSLC